MLQGAKTGGSFLGHLRVKGKGLVSFYQILFSLSGALSIDWPVPVVADAGQRLSVCNRTAPRPPTTPARRRPDWLDNVFSYLNFFMLDFPSLPGVGCLSKNNFVNSLYTSAALPACFVLTCYMLCRCRVLNKNSAWRWTVYVLYL